MRERWLTDDASDARARALGPTVHDELLAVGDRLATVSPGLAARCHRHAAAAWERFGAEGFRRWVALGEGLAREPAPCRDGALAYFDVAPEALGPDGLATAAAWCGLGRELADVSPRLAALFLERTGSLLGAPEAAARLGAWAAAAGRLARAPEGRGGAVARAFVAAVPSAFATLGPRASGAWGELALALAATHADRAVLAPPPPELAGWPDDDVVVLLEAACRLAGRSSDRALALWQTVPRAVAALPAPLRGELLAVVARLDARALEAVARVVPVLATLLRATPATEREAALGLVAEVAARAPMAAVAALRVLSRLYEEGTPDRIRAWFATGLSIVDEGPAVAEAYFGLVSRTSVRVLHAASTAATLEETRGVWAKVVQMLSGAGAKPRGTDGVTLRPPLEDAPGTGTVAMPLVVGLLPTHEDNTRVFRFVAAQLAGRRECATYAFVSAEGAPLRRHLTRPEAPETLEELFLVAEGVRVHHQMAARYPGLAADARLLMTQLTARWARETAPARHVVLDALLALAIAGRPGGAAPRWMLAAERATGLLAPLAEPAATVTDAVEVAEALAGALREATAYAAPDDLTGEDYLLADLGREGGVEVPGVETPGDADPTAPDAAPDDVPTVELGDATTRPPEPGRPLSRDEILRLLEAGVRIEQATSEGAGPGLSATDLAGKLPADVLQALVRALDRGGGHAGPTRRPSSEEDPDDACFWYDEWDHVLGDYRSRWCRLREIRLAGDEGEFFGRALVDYAGLIPEVRRQFQRIPPASYRRIRGLEDGEDFDLNAVVEARALVRARRAPPGRLYHARVREARDVATLFLVDMSASTDEPVTDERRIIDVTKAALVVMVEALEALGDAYAIYGFSGQGRDNVEVYPVKDFGDRLDARVKSRIGGIEPRRSTRMGAALRHVAVRMGRVSAKGKHVIMLSDGFPQDMDYGDDRRSHTYGIRDTAAALREVTAASITPVCITVDPGGHDYLRQMCDPHRYVVIDDVSALPRELPKIYQRMVRP